MTRILAIDPGSEQSAWLVFNAETQGIRGFAITPNDALLGQLRALSPDIDVVVIEQIESYGMAVGREVFATVHWAGRFFEAAQPMPVAQLSRIRVKQAICHDSRAKDANIRQALLDRFGGSAAQGTKKAPGPLYGISKDVWSALAIAITWAETQPSGGGPVKPNDYGPELVARRGVR